MNTDKEELSFENLKFNPFQCKNNILLDNLSDPDFNIYNENNLQNLILNISLWRKPINTFIK